MQSIIKLSDADKDMLLSSLPIIRENLDLFVIKFYSYFLKTDAGRLFKDTAMETQYRMFHSSLGIIITHIEHPALLEDHLRHLLRNHGKYGVLTSDLDLFIDSFMEALQDIYKDQFSTYRDIWFNLINDIMVYFAEGLQN